MRLLVAWVRGSRARLKGGARSWGLRGGVAEAEAGGDEERVIVGKGGGPLDESGGKLQVIINEI